MKFKVVASQGEITVRRIGSVPKTKKLPDGFVKMTPENGKYIIGHSETGHHHVIAAADAVVGVREVSDGMRVLYAILENPLKLEHLRGYDTHEPLENGPGVYQFTISREFDPYQELARIQQD